jgi:hypothetical protein
MTIRKGQEWGHFEERPSDLQLVADDVAACEVVSKCVIESSSTLNLSILKSDMARTLGITGATNLNSQMLCTKFDVIEATYVLTKSEETIRRCFIGRAFISEKLFFGRTIAVLNSSFVGNRDWAPKAHPNDGKLDLVELDGSMNVRQRLTALKLMKSGSHLPHPKIRYNQLSEYEYATDRSASLSIEGVRIGSIRHCFFRVLPDAVNLYW